jgi:hypothetical protein
MNSCICREAERCEDYPIDLGCLFLGEAALGINPQLGRRVTKEKALQHVRRCREAGLVHLIGRNKLDTMWLGVGPGDRTRNPFSDNRAIELNYRMFFDILRTDRSAENGFLNGSTGKVREVIMPIFWEKLDFSYKREGRVRNA